MPDVREKVFRANPAFRYLSAAALAPLGFRARTPGSRRISYAGALRPARNPWLGARAIDPVVAALFRALRKPRPVPNALWRRLGPHADREVARLVFDGVLEVQGKHGSVTAAAALAEFPQFAAPAPERLRGPTARLSLAALRHAAELPIDDAERLGARLYFHNRFPATPAWRHRVPDQPGAERFLRIEPGSSLRKRLEGCWTQLESGEQDSGWQQWWPRDDVRGARGTAQPCKVFVSPQPHVAAEALRIAVGVLESIGAPPFKIGRGPHGLLRPDKIVVYFAMYPDMLECTRALVTALGDIPPHGVPFSAAADDTGLVSWGLDPWNEAVPLTWRRAESWRVSVTARLARSIIIARHGAPGGPAADQFALARIALDNIDPVTWVPRDALGAAGEDPS